MENRNTIVTTVLLALGLFALSHRAEAVSPAPDGGYPNFTTAEGQNALFSLTTGAANTAVGWFSLWSNATGGFNTATGAGALLFNNGDPAIGEASENTAFGAAALLFNTTGSQNTADGTAALLSNTTGSGNTGTGNSALRNNTEGFANTANGAFALFSNTTGVDNTATGNQALQHNIIGVDNTAVGDGALQNNDSTGNGFGNFNTAVGTGALQSNTDGNSNDSVGDSALGSNTTGSFNEAMGVNALASNDSGFDNIAIGDDTLSNNVSGSHNIIVGGFGAGFNIVAGSNNIYIGPGESANGPFDESDTIRINTSAPAAGGTTSQVFFAGIDGSTVGAVNAPVLINPNGQLGTGVSSARFKKDIDPMGTTSEAIFSLKPVTFHYRGDTTDTPQFGLIAEEVAKVNPALILVDKEGKPYSVRYEHVNAMLLNEFLKEHKRLQQLRSTVQKEEAIIVQQQKRFETKLALQERQIGILTAGLERVSTQLAASSPPRGGVEVNEPAQQVVRNNP